MTTLGGGILLRQKDLRTISLCNVAYKTISKVLATQLKVFLNDIISLNQSAFVPGRLITDNVLLAYEMTHFMQDKRSVLKLDMCKAFDRVEWDFLEAIMVKLGLNNLHGILDLCEENSG